MNPLRTCATAVAIALAALGVTASRSLEAAVPTAHASSMCGTRSAAPTYRHVVLILFENHSYGSIVGAPSAPYLNSVIDACGIATNYHNLTHPSLPNYLGLTYGGSLAQLSRYSSDCDPHSCPFGTVPSNNLFNEVRKRGWMSFDESMPRACDRYSSGSYAARHNPAVYFNDLAKSCAQHDVSLGTPEKSALLADLAKGRHAPAFSFVTPNLCDDMHSCPTESGDQWLKTWLPLITGSAAYGQHDTAVFIVWDEGEPESVGEDCVSNRTDQSCHVPAIVVAPSVRPGTEVSTRFTHYSLLKTIELLLHVPQLGGARAASSMVKGFNL